MKDILDNAADTLYFLSRMSDFNHLSINLIKQALNHPEVKQIMDDEQFDLVILEGMGQSDSLLGFGAHFNSPIILISSVEPMRMLNSIIGNPQPYAFVPHVMLGFETPMGFKHRLYNMLFTVLGEIMLHFLLKPHYEIYKYD